MADLYNRGLLDKYNSRPGYLVDIALNRARQGNAVDEAAIAAGLANAAKNQPRK